ncbi:NADP-dependent oxidoreductase [Streptomyces capillispiralis]|uniref:NADPH:quinone reductase-like Zn-dependent oxidoreductase n=1 Tax=Streptomyces capillispiralis TaxID=68182 RepID=A0A561TC95_9ACTN|nr:NADP-dependent oxidoreductase [Streptomyces capillispiralis]TWF84737.1 NADPH:quinone reductase-like Zn-dependent oxidoreductase [Streptomyces capillispiralis]GHH95795.1 NADPH:quinone reductase [Streptomyces capillispiralis]
MRAVTIDDFGAAPAVTEVAKPSPGPGEILVRVRASSLNGFDGAVVYGVFKDMLEHKFPVTLGKDFAGTVEAVGEGVRRAVGERVFGVVMKPVVQEGSFAEYVVVAEGYGIASLPDDLDFTRAGALALAGTAAANAVDTIAPREGETVLVVGATGGVGAYAVQLASAAGATVLATAKPGEESDFVQALGAAHTVDHTADLAAQVRSVAPEGVAAVIHLAGDPAPLLDLVAPGGRLASTLGFGPEQAAGRDLTVTSLMANPDPATLERIATAAAKGDLKVGIGETYGLDGVAQALGAFGAGTLGKIAISVD